ncbi:hypothetical protein [Flaviaesturariibacter terrae]
MSPYLTYFGLLALTVYILFLVSRRRRREAIPSLEQQQGRLQAFKRGADRYPVDFDRCDFRDRSYAEEVPEDISDLQMAAGVLAAGPLVMASNRTELQETVQTLLYYQDPAVLAGRRLAQVLPIDPTTLRYHVLEGHVFLYVSRTKPGQYLFALEEPAP